LVVWPLAMVEPVENRRLWQHVRFAFFSSKRFYIFDGVRLLTP
jgi:hypothetical protein